MSATVGFTVNGTLVCLPDPGERSLLDVLRADLGLKGPKYGCGLGQCGACTVLVGGKPARSCVLRARRVIGLAVTTIEGLADPVSGALSPVQRGFLDCEGAQCGYCLNGMVMTATALLAANPNPSPQAIKDALRHHLCRCGSHKEIVESVRRAAEITGAARSGEMSRD